MKDQFAVFILSFGRPENVKTYQTLRKSGFTGKIYIICSEDDPTLNDYKRLYPNEILTFNKEDYINKFDIADNFTEKNVVVYARNSTFDIAEKLGIEYFLVLDDDYSMFNFRFDNTLNYDKSAPKIKRNLDQIFERILEFYKQIPALSISLAQGGDFIGGQNSGMASQIKIKRKLMNTFFCSTQRKFKFIGRINEDVNTYVRLATKGNLMFQTNQIGIEQETTQANPGGLTEFYLDTGTYRKSFYTVMISPSCTKIGLMGNKDLRLHHIINWKKCAPKIIQEKYKL